MKDDTAGTLRQKNLRGVLETHLQELQSDVSALTACIRKKREQIDDISHTLADVCPEFYTHPIAAYFDGDVRKSTALFRYGCLPLVVRGLRNKDFAVYICAARALGWLREIPPYNVLTDYFGDSIGTQGHLSTLLDMHMWTGRGAKPKDVEQFERAKQELAQWDSPIQELPKVRTPQSAHQTPAQGHLRDALEAWLQELQSDVSTLEAELKTKHEQIAKVSRALAAEKSGDSDEHRKQFRFTHKIDAYFVGGDADLIGGAASAHKMTLYTKLCRHRRHYYKTDGRLCCSVETETVRNKDFAVYICAAYALNWLRAIPSYNALTEFFGDIGAQGHVSTFLDMKVWTGKKAKPKDVERFERAQRDLMWEIEAREREAREREEREEREARELFEDSTE